MSALFSIISATMEKQQKLCSSGSDFSAKKTKNLSRRKEFDIHQEAESEISSTRLLPLFDEHPSWVKKPKTSSRISSTFVLPYPGRDLKELSLFDENRVTHNSANRDDSIENESAEELERKSVASDISAELSLQRKDPYTIKKKITASDVGQQTRLLLSPGLVSNHILPFLDADARKKVEADGAGIKIWDVDTETEHTLILKKWDTSKCYSFISRWTRDFVKRRSLNKDDVIGMHWDSEHSRLNFCVLSKAVANQDQQ